LKKILEELGWDRDLIESFKISKSEIQVVTLDDYPSTQIYFESNEKADGPSIKGIFEAPVGSDSLIVR